ncbi:Uncharacterised protein [Vibrio cholerae]|nr:Uncharacterised protein [Vibrio cholerae]
MVNRDHHPIAVHRRVKMLLQVKLIAGTQQRLVALPCCGMGMAAQVV